MKTKVLHLISGAVLAVAGFANAGESIIAPPVVEPQDPWTMLRRPISNPTLFDQVVPRTQIHPIFMTQNLPSTLDTQLGPVPMDGDFQVYALQIEFALTERLSINATKDGYIVFSPEETFGKAEGWANLAAGLKYAWLYKPEKQMASSIQLLYEIPAGDDDVWQGEGSGAFIPSISGVCILDRLQLTETLGAKIPVSDEDSSMLFASMGASYQLTDWLFPLVEVNWFHVVDPGDGNVRFPSQVGGAVPAVANFEGGDLINLGASNSDVNEDFVSLAVGARVRCPQWENVEFGAAYEFPLTDDEKGLMESRVTVDVVIHF